MTVTRYEADVDFPEAAHYDEFVAEQLAERYGATNAKEMTMTNAISGGYNSLTGRYEATLADGSIRVRKYAALDDDGELIGLYDSRDAAAGACQDAANEADSDGAGYTVETRWEIAASDAEVR